MIYHDPNDPEAGFFHSDDLIPLTTQPGRFYVKTYDEFRDLEPMTECGLCPAPIPDDAEVPLCRNCEATARVAGQQAADARRFPDPEVRR